MNHLSGHFPANRSEFVKLIESTEYAGILRDEAKLEKTITEVMKSSDDPITREIGQGLTAGTMTWQTIAKTSAYSGFLDHGLTALRQFDFNRLAADLETAMPETTQQKTDDRNRHDDDGEDLWQGLRRNRR